MKRVILFVGLSVAGCHALPPLPGGGARPQTDTPVGLRIERVQPPAAGAASGLLATMATELARAMSSLQTRGEHPPYFIAYAVTDSRLVKIRASYGALGESSDQRRRLLDVDVRVGDHHFDNTHAADARGVSSRMGRGASGPLPLDDDPEAVRRSLWLSTDAAYKAALERFGQARASHRINIDEDDQSDDFSEEQAAVFHGQPAAIVVDRPAWEQRLRTYSALFRQYPEILRSAVELEATATTRTLATSEGTALQTGRTQVRLSFTGYVKADDGEELVRVGSIDGSSVDALPDDGTIRARIQTVIDDLLALRAAPTADPFAGPAILEGRAAAVFFHETFGHRVEGHRQKSESEGQTFARKVGERVMPSFISVFDDPGIGRLNGVELNGTYPFDDEGVAGRRAQLVDGGVLTGYLMSRAPIRGFDHSNGHGRREPGHRAVARQANLVIAPSRTTTPERLKSMLLAEIKRQGRPYGLRFREIAGGFTFTSRDLPQAFKVQPVMMFRVYPDGHEELVRGADFEGTPLTALSKILAADSDYAVFNGYCGGESGFIPVSATSPSLLVEQIEVSRKPKSDDRPPLLGPPTSAAPQTAAEGGAS